MRIEASGFLPPVVFSGDTKCKNNADVIVLEKQDLYANTDVAHLESKAFIGLDGVYGIPKELPSGWSEKATTHDRAAIDWKEQRAVLGERRACSRWTQKNDGI